jgi:hypothetical protein
MTHTIYQSGIFLFYFFAMHNPAPAQTGVGFGNGSRIDQPVKHRWLAQINRVGYAGQIG